MEPCTKFSPVKWRTPNEWYFVAVCQHCGLTTSSAIDGAMAMRKLEQQHDAAENKG